MSEYKQGSFGASTFKKKFGLSSVGEKKAYSEGSTTGTKQTGALGTYMKEGDYNRLKNDSKTWEAYASVHGQEAADAKRESNPDGLSINALDSLMDDLSGDKGGGGGATEEVVYSPGIQEAKERVKNWEDSVASGEQSEGIFGPSNDDPVNETSSASDQTKQAAQAFVAREKRDVGKMLNEDIKV